uniref:Uncharacterized protein n=1 Tax=viral metagenome TaxID=1070528 RepID=A0A6M3M9B9_9ZZZZ
MSLPIRGTGLLTGRARTDRGYGWPLTEAERLERHYATNSGDINGVLFMLAAVAATGLIIWLVSKK